MRGAHGGAEARADPGDLDRGGPRARLSTPGRAPSRSPAPRVAVHKIEALCRVRPRFAKKGDRGSQYRKLTRAARRSLAMGTSFSDRWRFIDDRCDRYEAEWRARL